MNCDNMVTSWVYLITWEIDLNLTTLYLKCLEKFLEVKKQLVFYKWLIFAVLFFIIHE